MPKKIVIFGASSPVEGDEEYNLAYEVGKLIGELGFTVINGGYIGTMEASSKGAKENGGKAIGVTSKTLTYSPPNKYNDEVMEAEDLFERIRIMVEMGDAFVVLKGSTGTLTELLHAWEHLNMGKTNAPVICFGSHWKNITEQLDNGRKAIPLKELKFVDSLEELREVLANI